MQKVIEPQSHRTSLLTTQSAFASQCCVIPCFHPPMSGGSQLRTIFVALVMLDQLWVMASASFP